MNEELFTRYFISDLPSVDLLIHSISIKIGDTTFHTILLEELKLRHVGIRDEIRQNSKKLTDLSFKTYLNSLLIELRSSSAFYSSCKLSGALDHNQIITINELAIFNTKIAGYLYEYYRLIFPDLFATDFANSHQEGLIVFTSDVFYAPFEKYMASNIIDPYVDISYLFQRMKEEGIIHNVPHLKFAQWLYEMNYINTKVLQKIEEERGFRTLRKCTTAARENNFNNLFAI
ncbi:hypothetical protein P0M11_04160 [Kaistella sp. PBT33-4]|uniref:hypothetical protein n=1 Tax=Kaistella sp. PBT33-4 TaxID=3032000 RepID=UPI0023D823CA|nr:hypothetical protein [Kaistella sp. PBT33-4]MDF0719189.1 hypothetical protein [Kaistella sp. PBT33-4]